MLGPQEVKILAQELETDPDALEFKDSSGWYQSTTIADKLNRETPYWVTIAGGARLLLAMDPDELTGLDEEDESFLRAILLGSRVELWDGSVRAMLRALLGPVSWKTIVQKGTRFTSRSLYLFGVPVTALDVEAGKVHPVIGGPS